MACLKCIASCRRALSPGGYRLDIALPETSGLSNNVIISCATAELSAKTNTPMRFMNIPPKTNTFEGDHTHPKLPITRVAIALMAPTNNSAQRTFGLLTHRQAAGTVFFNPAMVLSIFPLFRPIQILVFIVVAVNLLPRHQRVQRWNKTK